jgi:CRP-like cAMP-binding protein
MASRQPDFLFRANRLLASLARDEYARLRDHLEPVKLAKGSTLFEVGDEVRHAYFLNGGMVSLLAVTAADAITQVAMVGGEGVVGVPSILRIRVMPYRVIVQLPCSAARIKAAALDAEFRRGGALADALLRYIHTLITQITQSAVCNRHHTIEKRLCRWLLISRDRAQSDLLPLTQESLAHMLGAQRPGVTAAAIALQDGGMISYRRGMIRIVNREGLAALSCECYQTVSEDIALFLTPKLHSR